MKTSTTLSYLNSIICLSLFLTIAYDIKAQYVYMDDNGTSWVQTLAKKDIVIASHFKAARERSVQLAYSPMHTISIKAGLFSHYLDQNISDPNYPTHSKGLTYSGAVGYYKTFKTTSYINGQIDSTAQFFFYLDFGFSRGRSKNNIGTLFRSSFEFQKYMLESSVGYQSKYGIFSFNLRYALIHFRKAKIIGSDNQFESFVFETRDKLAARSTYPGWTINIQYRYDVKRISILLGFPVFLPHVRTEKRVPIPVAYGPYLALGLNFNSSKGTGEID